MNLRQVARTRAACREEQLRLTETIKNIRNAYAADQKYLNSLERLLQLATGTPAAMVLGGLRAEYVACQHDRARCLTLYEKQRREQVVAYRCIRNRYLRDVTRKGLLTAVVAGLSYFTGLGQRTQSLPAPRETPSLWASSGKLESHLIAVPFEIGDTLIAIDTRTQEERVYEVALRELLRQPVSTALRRGSKERAGDGRTPENGIGEIFKVLSVQDASTWLDPWEGKRAYGPYFARIDTEDASLARMSNGVSPIGLHGTHEPELLGKPASHGCVRHENSALKKMYQRGLLAPGTGVVIREGLFDVE